MLKEPHAFFRWSAIAAIPGASCSYGTVWPGVQRRGEHQVVPQGCQSSSVRRRTSDDVRLCLFPGEQAQADWAISAKFGLAVPAGDSPAF
jgi:hypothetical protein